MLRILLSYVQVAHVSIILYLTLQLYQYPNVTFNLNLSIAQLVLTVIDVFLIKRSFDLFPLLVSGVLFTSFLPPLPIDVDWIVILFVAKIVYINDILGDAKRLLFSGDNCAFCQVGSIIYNFVRFTVVEYLFLGVIIMIYKAIVLHFDQSVTELPENYVLFYQMIVAATTIGYGDVCPKSRIQMNFFIGAIPFVCGSFVVYINNVNPLWDQFLAFWNSSSQKVSQSVINVQSMTPSEKDNLNEFTVLSTERKIAEENMRHSYFNDWISIAAINYEKGAELIHTIIDPTFPKEIKLAVTSKVRHEYFPKDWVILDANDINQELFMVVEGQIDINGVTKSTGFVFNQKGFFCRASSGDKVVTKTFVTVMAISLTELEELGENCSRLKEKINSNIASYS